MTELRLHRELYAGAAVDEAVRLYDPFATLERADEAAHWVLRITAPNDAREGRISRELANYALGLTIKGRTA